MSPDKIKELEQIKSNEFARAAAAMIVLRRKNLTLKQKVDLERIMQDAFGKHLAAEGELNHIKAEMEPTGPEADEVRRWQAIESYNRRLKPDQEEDQRSRAPRYSSDARRQYALK